MELPTTEEINGYVADFRQVLKEGSILERKALIRNFVQGIEVSGEEAVLIVVGAYTSVLFVPTSPLDAFTALPVQIYSWISRPLPAFQDNAAAGIIVLLTVLLLMNAVAITLRNIYSRSVSEYSLRPTMDIVYIVLWYD